MPTRLLFFPGSRGRVHEALRRRQFGRFGPRASANGVLPRSGRRRSTVAIQSPLS